MVYKLLKANHPASSNLGTCGRIQQFNNRGVNANKKIIEQLSAVVNPTRSDPEWQKLGRHDIAS